MKNGKWKRMHLGRENGFSLIEVVIALSIFGTALLFIAAMQSNAMKANMSSRLITDYSVMASQKLESLMLLPWGHNDLTDRNGDGKAGLGNTGALTSDWNWISPDNRYAIYWNVADNLTCENTKTVSIIIQWEVKENDRRHVVIQGVVPRVVNPDA